MKIGLLKTGELVATDGERAVALTQFDGVRAFLEAADGGIEAAAAELDAGDGRSVKAADFAAPYAQGAKIVCHVVNFVAHATGVGPPSTPYFFTKPATAVLGNGDPIQAHTHMSKELDWENELALVIGKEARNVSEDDAYDYVAGFTIVNDVSHREYQFGKLTPDLRQRYGMNWTQGKGLDASCPIGPWIVLRDELPDPYPLQQRTWVNGELRQDASTAEMVHKIPALLADITRGMTFLPGDIVACGTPSGTAMDDEATAYLKPGDVVTCEIERIGRLENPVVDS